MIFFAFLLISMIVALIAQHFIGPLPVIGSRVLLMPIIMFYGALALPPAGMLVLAFCGAWLMPVYDFIFESGFQQLRFGRASAVGIVLTLIIIGVTALQFRLSRRFVFYQ